MKTVGGKLKNHYLFLAHIKRFFSRISSIILVAFKTSIE